MIYLSEHYIFVPTISLTHILNKNLISEREKEVLTLYLKGLNYIDIAVQLAISPSTVRKHIENIYKKLEVHNKMEAMQKAIKNKLIEIKS
ncbi:MAG: response regulator transcription factor [Vicingus serpentipes]|nr:response regulator transcription factor [Vicingus serpentipes]